MDISVLYDKYLESGTVSTDTRQITPGSIFFALKGDRFNANTFAIQALEKGARYVVIDEAEYNTDPRCILVEDVLKTLQQLARTTNGRFFTAPTERDLEGVYANLGRGLSKKKEKQDAHSSNDELKEKLEKLNRARADGVLTEEEFERKKQELLQGF